MELRLKRGELADNENKDGSSAGLRPPEDQLLLADRLINLPLFLLPVNRNNFCLPFMEFARIQSASCVIGRLIIKEFKVNQ